MRAHTPAYIHDTHVKWSGARSYIHTYMLHAPDAHAHTLTHVHVRSGVKLKHNNYIGNGDKY